MVIKNKFDSQYEAAWSDADVLVLSLDTGGWRTQRPVVDKEKCSYCGLCYLYCPVQCMVMKEDYFLPDLQYCKGCGICARECSRNAITMVSEKEL
jgi:pyruvate ferredoxin oxidoreductase delta subunit